MIGGHGHYTVWYLRCGFYCHNLLLPIAGGYWLAAVTMKFHKKLWLSMVVSQAFALLVSSPMAILALRQENTSGGMAWLRDYWRMTPPSLAIPKSLEILALGGAMPRYTLTLPLPWPLIVLATVLTICAAIAAFWPHLSSDRRGHAHGLRELGPSRSLFVVFTLWPLIFLFTYSLLRHPIYLVGRYDLFAQPAYLVILATGFSRIQSLNASRLAAGALPIIVASGLAVGIGNRYAFPLDPAIFHHRMRGLSGSIRDTERSNCLHGS